MLMPDTEPVPTLSATSLADPFAVCAEPLFDSVTSSWHEARPERASEQVKWTFTGLTYQPFLPTVPLTTEPLMTGLASSSFTVTESVPVLPAVSFAEPLTTTPDVVVSALITWSGVTLPAATPEPGSVSLASKCTVTSLLFQSDAFAFGLTVWVTVGAMLSYLSVTCWLGSLLPATSTAWYFTVAAPVPVRGTM